MRSLQVLLLLYCGICLIGMYDLYMLVPDRDVTRVRSVTESTASLEQIIDRASEHSPSLEEVINQTSATKRRGLLQEITINGTLSPDRMPSHSTTLSRNNATKIQDSPAMLERARLYLRFLDTARTIDESLSGKPKTKRFPDVINIGVEKCGTGFLREILRRHPKFLFPKEAELHFFSNRWDAGVTHYRKQMPESSPYHVVIEKSPSYFNFASKMVPQRVYTLIPRAKIIVLLCDPVNRTFSDFFHEIAMGKIPEEADFNSYMPNIIARNKEVLSHQNSDRNAIDFIFRRLPATTNYHLISTALYYYHMIRWLQWFPRNQIYVIDGEELIHNPGKVAEELQNYLEVPKLIIKEDFEKGPNGFYCIRTPKVEERMGIRRVEKGALDCLNKANKGRTRLGGTQYQPSENILSELRDFYRPFNEKLYRLLGCRFQWD